MKGKGPIHSNGSGPSKVNLRWRKISKPKDQVKKVLEKIADEEGQEEYNKREETEEPDNNEDTVIFEDFQEDSIVGSILQDYLDASFFAQRPKEALLVSNMHKMLNVNLGDISTMEEDVQREQEAAEKML
ncbi:hypothetical protein KI387_029758, partial [Taxus chinensis]